MSCFSGFPVVINDRKPVESYPFQTHLSPQSDAQVVVGMGTYLVLEIGHGAYARLKREDGEFRPTEDVLLVGRVEAWSELEAIKKVRKLEHRGAWQYGRLVGYAIESKKQKSFPHPLHQKPVNQKLFF